MKHADILAYDRLGSPVLLVEVQGKAYDDPDHDQQNVQYLLDEWRHAQRPVPFAMLVDPRRIRIFRDRRESPVAVLPTEDVLRDYDPEVGSKEIFEFYWITLVQGWLRDLAFHWNSPMPPGSDVLGRVGLLPLLEGGDTVEEAAI
jgi:hypothetical protein